QTMPRQRQAIPQQAWSRATDDRRGWVAYRAGTDLGSRRRSDRPATSTRTVRVAGSLFRPGAVTGLEPLVENRKPLRKFVAAGESQPTLLHRETIGPHRFARRSLGRRPAFVRTEVALANVFADVLEHGARLLSRCQAGARQVSLPPTPEGRGR